MALLRLLERKNSMPKWDSIRQIDGMTPTISMEQLFSELGPVAKQDKLIAALGLAGCQSWDEEGRYIKGSSISLAGIGGLPVSKELLGTCRQDGKTIMATSAAMSYLNSGGKSLDDLYGTVTDKGHFSIAHTMTANLLVAGVSTAVENEFNSQRDVVHLSRVTVGRTSIQQRPPIITPTEDDYPVTRAITEFTDHQLAGIQPSKLDDWERRNILYPSAKATLFLATASLRNFQKLVSQKNDGGKEAEYRTTLTQIEECLNTLWPELFIEGRE